MFVKLETTYQQMASMDIHIHLQHHPKKLLQIQPATSSPTHQIHFRQWHQEGFLLGLFDAVGREPDLEPLNPEPLEPEPVREPVRETVGLELRPWDLKFVGVR